MPRPTWAEVSLFALIQNFAVLRDFVGPGAQVCAVVKCDAYGHGAVQCARALENVGAKWLAVTSADEGIQLRQAGIRSRILLMSGMYTGEAETIVEHNLTPAIWRSEQIVELNLAAEKQAKKDFPIHIEADTGMARQGTTLQDLPLLLASGQKSPRICIEGLYSHLASAEVTDAVDVEQQLAAYARGLAQLAAAKIRPDCLHLANSAGLVAHKESWQSLLQDRSRSTVLVRAGISLYGYFLPFQLVSGEPSKVQALPVKPVLSWKTRIIDIRRVGAGQAVGYNGAYVTNAAATIATLPIGYGDGLSRRLSSRGRVLVRGRYASIVGNVSMDVTTIDVSAIDGVGIGEEVIIIGEQGEAKLTAWELARNMGSIPYEVLCNISKRVPRIYKNGNTG